MLPRACFLNSTAGRQVAYCWAPVNVIDAFRNYLNNQIRNGQ